MIVDIVYGFLGAGKTTFIINALKALGKDEETVVLVNEFGEVGIDGELLENQGGNVVEMPSGCICCTLQTDFRSQMMEITRNLKPERVIIEPTGVATIKQIHSIVGAQLFENRIQKIHSIMIADAAGFMELYKANRHFVESQTARADLVLLNKCDLVDKKKARVIRSAVSSINPGTTVLMTAFGVVDWAEYRQALSVVSFPVLNRFDPGAHDHHDEPAAGLGLASIGREYRREIFDTGALERFFRDLGTGAAGFGNIVRAKGVFRIGSKWILMELASGNVSSQPVRESDQSKVAVIGNDLNEALIIRSLDQCVSDADGAGIGM